MLHVGKSATSVNAFGGKNSLNSKIYSMFPAMLFGVPLPTGPPTLFLPSV
jgi:hypothetical protein